VADPVAGGGIEPTRAFLGEVRALATARGIVLIFDEVVVWPRVGLGGAQGLFGVRPALTAVVTARRRRWRRGSRRSTSSRNRVRLKPSMRWRARSARESPIWHAVAASRSR